MITPHSSAVPRLRGGADFCAFSFFGFDVVSFFYLYLEKGEVEDLPCSRSPTAWDTLDSPAALDARAVPQPELWAVCGVTPVILTNFNLKRMSSRICVGNKYKSLVGLLMHIFKLYCYKEHSNAGNTSDEYFTYFRLNSSI